MDRYRFSFRQQGVILPVVVIVSLILMTSISLWYRKVILQSFLSERLIEQRMVYKECSSLLPYLRQRLNEVSKDKLGQSDSEFLRIEVDGEGQWLVGRSEWINQNKIVFTFTPLSSAQETIRISMRYFVEEG